MKLIANIRAFFQDGLWRLDARSLDRPGRFAIRGLRMIYVLFRDLVNGELNLHAMSLVYTTLLSLVPFLAVTFSVLKAFGVHNLLEPTLANFLTPLGEKGIEIKIQILQFVQNMKVGVLGSVGMIFLLFTVVSLVQKIEYSVNAIWCVEKHRNFTQRFNEYLSVILVGPVLVFSAVGITASLMNSAVMLRMQEIEVVGIVFALAGKMVPYFFAIGAFTFVYKFMPHTYVKISAAVAGGVVAGIVWNTSGYGFAYFVLVSTNYTAVYSGFAIMILFIIWVYLSWLVFLLGTQIAFYVQRPDLVRKDRDIRTISNRYKEYLCLSLMKQIGQRYNDGCPPARVVDLERENRESKETVLQVLRILMGLGLLRKTDEEAYVPAKPLQNMLISDLLSAIRGAEDRDFVSQALDPDIVAILDRSHRAIEGELGGLTLQQIVSRRENPKIGPISLEI